MNEEYIDAYELGSTVAASFCMFYLSKEGNNYIIKGRRYMSGVISDENDGAFEPEFCILFKGSIKELARKLYLKHLEEETIKPFVIHRFVSTSKLMTSTDLDIFECEDHLSMFKTQLNLTIQSLEKTLGSFL